MPKRKNGCRTTHHKIILRILTTCALGECTSSCFSRCSRSAKARLHCWQAKAPPGVGGGSRPSGEPRPGVGDGDPELVSCAVCMCALMAAKPGKLFWHCEHLM
jgi:hypothetical protein